MKRPTHFFEAFELLERAQSAGHFVYRDDIFEGGDPSVPQEKHLRGVGPKEQKQYEHIVESAKRDHRYKGREKEVAARTVLKEHREKGHSKGH